MMTFEDVYEYIMKKFYRLPGEASPIRLRFKRNEMAGLFSELGYKVGAEIGVHQGEYSESLCAKNPKLKLYCIDPWETYESEVEESFSQNQRALNGFYEDTKKRLAPYRCEIIRKTSMEAVKKFIPGSLDFVYIDANHDFKHVTEDIGAWAEVVRRGGIVSGHDYGHYKHRNKGLGAKKAIDNHVKEYDIRTLFLVNKNYQTSWFFVKE